MAETLKTKKSGGAREISEVPVENLPSSLAADYTMVEIKTGKLGQVVINGVNSQDKHDRIAEDDFVRSYGHEPIAEILGDMSLGEWHEKEREAYLQNQGLADDKIETVVARYETAGVDEIISSKYQQIRLAHTPEGKEIIYGTTKGEEPRRLELEPDEIAIVEHMLGDEDANPNNPEYESLKTELADLRARFDNLEKSLKQEQELNVRLTTENQRMQIRLNELSAEKEQLAEERDGLRKGVRDLHEQLQDAQEEIENAQENRQVRRTSGNKFLSYWNQGTGWIGTKLLRYQVTAINGATNGADKIREFRDRHNEVVYEDIIDGYPVSSENAGMAAAGIVAAGALAVAAYFLGRHSGHDVTHTVTRTVTQTVTAPAPKPNITNLAHQVHELKHVNDVPFDPLNKAHNQTATGLTGHLHIKGTPGNEHLYDGNTLLDKKKLDWDHRGLLDMDFRKHLRKLHYHVGYGRYGVARYKSIIWK